MEPWCSHAQKHEFVIVCTQSKTACCEAKISCPMANSDKKSKWLKEKGGETATYIKKKKRKRRYSKTIKGKSLDEGEERGLPSRYKKKKKKEQAAARSWHVCFYLYKSVTLDLW